MILFIKLKMKDMTDYIYRTSKGKLNKTIVEEISKKKNEPSWVTKFRLRSLGIFSSLKLPNWGPDLSNLNLNDLYYYIKPIEGLKRSWNDVPKNIKSTFDALGIIKAEQKMLAGVGAQFESEIIYKNLKTKWKKKGVIFCDINTGFKKYAKLLKKYFSKVVTPNDNFFAALNSAVFSGGNFVYIPPGIKVDMPLQAYFRINQSSMGQFERTLIIADKGSSLHYIEGCSAPIYQTSSLHAAVVEIVALQESQVTYTTIQNWATNVYNLVTKRAVVYKNASVSWIDGNFGSKITMKYPSVILKEPGASGNILSIAIANNGQHIDSGGKAIHLAKQTSSTIISKSISQNGGLSSYRGTLKVVKDAENVRARVQCDALILDSLSQSNAYPTIDIHESKVDIGHEASVSKVDDEQLFYLASRGIKKEAAMAMIVHGFIDPFVKTLPLEYAVELNRLIAMQMKDSIG